MDGTRRADRLLYVEHVIKARVLWECFNDIAIGVKEERAATAKKKKAKSKGGRKQFVANTKKAKVKT